jgi:hypothetical protein
MNFDAGWGTWAKAACDPLTSNQHVTPGSCLDASHRPVTNPSPARSNHEEEPMA